MLGTQPLLPVELGPGSVHYAQGVKAGRWVFASGHLAQDFKNGVPQSVRAAGMPLETPTPAECEAELIFDHLDALLVAAGTSRENIVRIDQYYTGTPAIPPYQRTRRRRLGNTAHASTSMVMEQLLLPDASMVVDAIAVIPSGDFRPQEAPKPKIAAISGPSPTIVAGDFVFISGQLATADVGAPARDGLAEEACVPATAFWGGNPIRVETEYILKRRIAPALERAGSSPAGAVKAQIYLTHLEDIPVFNQVWAEFFGTDIPATTIIPAPKRSIGIATARVEINLVALRNDAIASQKRVIRADVAPAYAGHPAAVKAGDLLFLSGLMANDANGLVSAARIDPRQPYFGSSPEAQAAYIIEKAERICAAAGASLANIVRMQQFHTDLGDFYPAYAAWQRRLGDQPLPFSAIGIPGTPAIPGCSLLSDLWIYSP